MLVVVVAARACRCGEKGCAETWAERASRRQELRPRMVLDVGGMRRNCAWDDSGSRTSSVWDRRGRGVVDHCGKRRTRGRKRWTQVRSESHGFIRGAARGSAMLLGWLVQHLTMVNGGGWDELWGKGTGGDAGPGRWKRASTTSHLDLRHSEPLGLVRLLAPSTTRGDRRCSRICIR